MPDSIPYYDAEEANHRLLLALKANEVLQANNAALASALEAASRLCYLKKSGFCYLGCQGAVLCDQTGLTFLDWPDLPAALREEICRGEG